VSRVLAFDYLGALVVSLVFPLVLAPYLRVVAHVLPVRVVEHGRGRSGRRWPFAKT
jgi:predicted membrane-bound spermidine synthase